jgi:hypothetical protein
MFCGLLYNGYQFFPGGKDRPGCDADPSPPSSAVGHERVELYLYSPCGPYGLYRTSVPVQGWPLFFFTLCLGVPHANMFWKKLTDPSIITTVMVTPSTFVHISHIWDILTKSVTYLIIHRYEEHNIVTLHSLVTHC